MREDAKPLEQIDEVRNVAGSRRVEEGWEQRVPVCWIHPVMPLLGQMSGRPE